MVLLAIFLSRFEAVEIASMLRGYGIFVSLDGEYFTATTYQSVTLGGYRMRVCAEDHAAASEILRQSGAPERDLYRTSPRPILLWMVWFFLTAYGTVSAALISMGATLWFLGWAPYSAMTLPIDPKN